jgi:hypothetical protein
MGRFLIARSSLDSGVRPSSAAGTFFAPTGLLRLRTGALQDGIPLARRRYGSKLPSKSDKAKGHDMMHRRYFIQRAAAASALAGLGDFGFLSRLRPVSAAEAKLDTRSVRFHPDIEPLVRLIEDTPRDRLLEEVAARLRRGLSYREVLAALLLAGVRNIQPRPVGFKFHAVLVVNSAHLASLASPETDRWLPIFWALDSFKSSQAQDVKEGDWTMAPVDESKTPPALKARQAFTDAMDRWDAAAADAAIAGLVRTAGAHELFEVFSRYGARDFRDIGHKAIYVANAFRTLECIGWHHAEPVLRSLAYALLDRGRDANPATSDLDADRPGRRNLELRGKIRADWQDGQAGSEATGEMLKALRRGSANDASDKVVELLNRGASSQSVWDALFHSAGELLMNAPGIRSLHAVTTTNAMHHAFRHCGSDATRRFLLLQNAAFLPLFRGETKLPTALDTLEPLAPKASGAGALEEIFADVGRDKTRLDSARKTLAWLQDNPDPRPFADAARRLIFLKGRDSHDYKFSSAVLEDCQFMAPPWRDRCLAASLFHLRGSTDADNPLVSRIRAALGAA